MSETMLQVSWRLKAQKCSDFCAVKHVCHRRAVVPGKPLERGGTGTRLFLYNEKRTNVYKYIGRTDTEWKVRQSACLASNGAIAREGFGSTHCS